MPLLAFLHLRLLTHTQYDTKYPSAGWVAENDDVFGQQTASDAHRAEHEARLAKQKAKAAARAQEQESGGVEGGGEDGLDGCIIQ